jgi:hypothetical protein
VNGTDPETINVIKDYAQDIFNTQYRCVTKADWRAYLEARSDVVAASVWGEKEETLNGNIQEYNKVHISIIPSEWTGSTITTVTSGWQPYDDPINVEIPVTFSSTFENTLSEYIEPRKIINAWEIYELPELVYFYFELGMKVKSIYNFSNVARDVRNKIIWYFNAVNRNFNETIDFRDIICFVQDTSETSPSNNFPNITGIRSLVFRDFNLSITPNSYDSDTFPKYTMDQFDINIDNTIRPIQLGYYQFPAINEDLIIINNEG